MTPDPSSQHGRAQSVSDPPAGPATPRGVPLASVPAGATVRVAGVDAGMGLTSRLTSMGLVRGVELRVVRNRGRGPAVVEVMGVRLALGRGMAAKILVR